MFFPLKGNADLIKKLKRIGFQESYREKTGNSFYQKMEYIINYDKYAIYQGKYGLYPMLYVDNVFDFKRYGLLGNPYDLDLPIVVNRMGGRHTFREEYEEGFLYIKEVLEDEEPLTREEMFPKNNDNFFYGWIDKEGNTYSCSFEGHYKAAEAICAERGINSYNEERALEEAGWIKISRKVPYTYENRNSRAVYFDALEHRLTKQQVDKLYELGLENDDIVRHFIEKDEDYER